MTFAILLSDGMSALERSEFEEAATLFREAMSVATGDADHALAAMRLAAIDVLRHSPNPSLGVFRENVMRRHSPFHVVVAAYYLTIAAIDWNDRDAATRYLPVLLENVGALNDQAWLSKAYDVAAGAESIRGNHEAAIEYGRVALEALPAGDELLRVGTIHNLAYNSLAASRYDDALRYANDALQAAESIPAALPQTLVTAAFANVCCDRLDEASETIERAAPVIAGSRLEKYGHYLRGEIARRRGDRAEATAHFRELEASYPEIPGLTEMLLELSLIQFLLPE